MEKNNKRNASIEILRAAAMLFVVGGHMLVHGPLKNNVEPFSFNYIFYWSALAVAITGVNLYVLISGYFLSAKQNIEIKKITKITGLTWFYSVAIFALLIVFKQIAFDVKTLPRILLPVLTFSYWFVTVYALMYLFSPFYNKLIDALSKKEFAALLITGGAMLCFWPMLFIPYVPKLGGTGYLLWFTYLYFTAAYIRRHYTPDYKPAKFLFMFAGAAAALFLSKIILAAVMLRLTGTDAQTSFLYENNSFLVFAAATSLFLFFLNLRGEALKGKKFIYALAPAAFGVYLITEHIYLRPVIWRAVFDGYGGVKSGALFALYLVLCVVIIYFAASFIEIIRARVTRKIWKR